jgi:CheY-like chemotaxis protein
MAGRRILLAEDEMLIRELAAEDLSEAGYEVAATATGDEALARLEAGASFDLLFTDIRMPGEVDGVELARRARALNPELRVIYATGYDDPPIEPSPQERCIRKPYVFQDVQRLLTALGLSPA